ncbi:MAG: O-methyltransferase [Acidobacteriota bacterium]
MICYQSVWNDIHHPFHARFANGRELDRLNADGGVSRMLASVISDVRDGHLLPEEAVWRERIESLRASMNRSDEMLEIADYGAQSPLKKLSDDEMYKGRVIVRRMGELCRSSSKPPKWSLFLFRLVRAFAPCTCIELGTCLGISGAYIGAALALNGKGRLITIEGAESLAKASRRNFDELGLPSIEVVPGRFQDVLPCVLESAKEIQMVFIDGHHDGPSTLRYFETIVPSLADNAIVIFDDIAWSKEMHEAWKALERHPRVRLSADMFDMGLCCIGTQTHQRFRIAV